MYRFRRQNRSIRIKRNVVREARTGLFLAQQSSKDLNIDWRIGRAKSKNSCYQTSYKINLSDSDRSLGGKRKKLPQIVDSLELTNLGVNSNSSI